MKRTITAILAEGLRAAEAPPLGLLLSIGCAFVWHGRGLATHPSACGWRLLALAVSRGLDGEWLEARLVTPTFGLGILNGPICTLGDRTFSDSSVEAGSPDRRLHAPLFDDTQNSEAGIRCDANNRMKAQPKINANKKPAPLLERVKRFASRESLLLLWTACE
jgi:hypothetical protein